jgi:hypothetical protein
MQAATMMSSKNALSFYERGMEKGTYGNIKITQKLVKLSYTHLQV